MTTTTTTTRSSSTTTTIEWTGRRLPDGTMIPGYTFNPVWGCMKVSEGCRYCYALSLARRMGYPNLWGPDYWQRPLQWNQVAARSGHRRSVFCGSMCDVFEEEHPTIEHERTKLWPLIERTPWLNWLLLTKRPHFVREMVPWDTRWPENVWIGTSVETQARAALRLPYLVELPARVRFLSCEPLLEELDLTEWLPQVQWVIVGGESGQRARPMHPSWARSLQEQCAQHQVPFFFKQWGGRTHKSGGRLLDGRLWEEMPLETPTNGTEGSHE
jgi:protein gp37